MAEKTGIAYVHHTRNFWSGCTKIGPGCDGCYAEAFNRWTRGKNPETGEAKNWGAHAPRIPHLVGAARDIRKWDREAEAAGGRRRVFLNTNSDTFDNEVPDAWRTALYESIRESDWLDFLLVTKRIGNVASMVPSDWMRSHFPSNVRLLITVVNQEEADRDIPKMLALPCKNGISYEPALGPIDFNFLWSRQVTRSAIGQRNEYRKLQWVIVGGESAQAGHEARLCQIEWIRSTLNQCKAAGVSIFVKQFGAHVGWNGMQNAETCWPGFDAPKREDTGSGHWRVFLNDRAGADPAEWPEDLRVREIPA